MRFVSLHTSPHTAVAVDFRELLVSYLSIYSCHHLYIQICRNDEPPSRLVMTVIATNNTKTMLKAFTTLSHVPRTIRRNFKACVVLYHIMRARAPAALLGKPTAFIAHSTCTGTPLIRDRRCLPRAKCTLLLTQGYRSSQIKTSSILSAFFSVFFSGFCPTFCRIFCVQKQKTTLLAVYYILLSNL